MANKKDEKTLTAVHRTPVIPGEEVNPTTPLVAAPAEVELSEVELSNEGEVKELNKALGVFGEKVTSLSAQVEKLQGENSKLKERLSQKVSKGDYAMVAGRRCGVVLKETAAEIARAVQRSEVDEDSTVLVLDVYNG